MAAKHYDDTRAAMRGYLVPHLPDTLALGEVAADLGSICLAKDQ